MQSIYYFQIMGPNIT